MSDKNTMLFLTLFDRLAISNFLPVKGKFEINIACRDIRKKLEVTQEEVVEFGVKEIESIVECPHCKKPVKTGEPGRVRWDRTKDTNKPFAFSELEMKVVVGQLKSMSDEENLPNDDLWLELYEKFVYAKNDNQKG